MIKRILENTIKNKLNNNKVIVIYGARQTGKTTLLKSMFKRDNNTVWINADRIDDKSLFEKESLVNFKSFLSGKKMLIIDEAQRIENIGLKLKIIYDEMDIKIIATGSSSFDLANKINEPLTGRKFEYQLFPLSFEELANHTSVFDEYKKLPIRLVFGSYPDVVTDSDPREILKNLTTSYLYKDILEWDKIKKSDKILKLLQALAFQIGNQVSYNELAQIVGINSVTIENYIDLLEKTFIIFRLNSFSRNLRNELKKSKKIYFFDNGIRNALINNFNLLELRNDTGALWENYLMSERYKFTGYHQIYTNRYFWRTKNQQEIDYIEERDGKLYAFEFKWNANRKYKFPKKFLESYPNNKTNIITPENYFKFITDF